MQKVVDFFSSLWRKFRSVIPSSRISHRLLSLKITEAWITHRGIKAHSKRTMTSIPIQAFRIVIYTVRWKINMDEKHIDWFFIVRSSNCTMTSWSRLKGFARSKAICRRVSLTRLFTAEGGIPPSKEIFVERSSSSRITTLIKFVAGKTDYSSCINVFLFFKKSHDISFIEILGRNLSARCFIASSKSRIFPCRKFSNRKCWKKQDLKYNRRRIFQSSALATLSRLKECR